MVKGKIGLISIVLLIIAVLFICVGQRHIQGVSNEEMTENIDINIEVSTPDVETSVSVENVDIEGNIEPAIDAEIVEELIKPEIDYTSFNASYNKLVATAQLEQGCDSSFYYQWVKNEFGCNIDNIEWSLAFLSWCSSQIGWEDIVPIYSDCVELELYFQSIDSYYRGSTGCWPRVGDIVLFDRDGDKIPEHAEIISYFSDGLIKTIGGCNQVDNSFIVSESKSFVGDTTIYGICRPLYNENRVEDYYNVGLPFNAVDTVVRLTEQSYADCLAENGIEVIARYINPEGRNPLTVEEAEMYFKAGIRVMMIYQINKDDPYKGYDVGVEFGERALEYARNLGAPKGTPIFFCCDCNNRPEYFYKLADFLLGVKDVMQGEYSVGLYGGYYTCEAMYNMDLIDAYWQCWGFSDRYLSDNYDIIQWSNGQYYFDEIPYKFDANYVKNPEKVSYILPVAESE